jgi:hypothetical protein
MLAIRQYIWGLQSRNDRGDYDALPLSDLRTGQRTSPPPTAHRQQREQSQLTLRRAGFTVLATLLVFTTAVYIFSLLHEDVDFEAPPIASPEYSLQVTGNGGFYRDAYPIRSMIKYWEIAEKEVQEHGLDTCKGQLGRELIDAYIRSTVDYCHPAVSSRLLVSWHTTNVNRKMRLIKPQPSHAQRRTWMTFRAGGRIGSPLVSRRIYDLSQTRILRTMPNRAS